MVRRKRPRREAKEPVHQRHNFSPSARRSDNYFILSSSLGLTRDLVKAAEGARPRPTDATLLVEADGAALARLLEQNRSRLVMQNMLEKGNDKARPRPRSTCSSASSATSATAGCRSQDGADAVAPRAGLHARPDRRSAEATSDGSHDDAPPCWNDPARAWAPFEPSAGRPVGPRRASPTCTAGPASPPPGRSSSATCATGPDASVDRLLDGEPTQRRRPVRRRVRRVARRDGGAARPVGPPRRGSRRSGSTG